MILCLAGSPFLFQVALALLKLNEKALLDCNSAAGVYSYLNGEMTHQGISIDGLIRESDGMRGMVKKADVERRREQAVKRELADMAISEEGYGRDGHGEAAGLTMEAGLVLDPPAAPAAVVTSPGDEDVGTASKKETTLVQEHPLASTEAAVGLRNETMDKVAETMGDIEAVASLSTTATEKSESPELSPPSSPTPPAAAAATIMSAV